MAGSMLAAGISAELFGSDTSSSVEGADGTTIRANIDTSAGKPFNWQQVALESVANSAISYGARKLFGDKTASWNTAEVIGSAFASIMGSYIGSKIKAQEPKETSKPKLDELDVDAQQDLAKGRIQNDAPGSTQARGQSVANIENKVESASDTTDLIVTTEHYFEGGDSDNNRIIVRGTRIPSIGTRMAWTPEMRRNFYMQREIMAMNQNMQYAAALNADLAVKQAQVMKHKQFASTPWYESQAFKAGLERGAAKWNHGLANNAEYQKIQQQSQMFQNQADWAKWDYAQVKSGPTWGDVASGVWSGIKAGAGFAYDLGAGLVEGAANVVWQPVAQALDLAELAFVALPYNLFADDNYELTGFSNVSQASGFWDGMRKAYEYNPIGGVGIGAYDATTAFRNGDYKTGTLNAVGTVAGIFGAKGLNWGDVLQSPVTFNTQGLSVQLNSAVPVDRIGVKSPVVKNGQGLTGKGWSFNSARDIDLRGQESTWLTGVDAAFKRIEDLSGVTRSQFKPIKRAYTSDGKSVVVKWEGPKGANVNLDIPDLQIGPHGIPKGPAQPHIGWKAPGKIENGRGHIFVDGYIPATRTRIDIPDLEF